MIAKLGSLYHGVVDKFGVRKQGGGCKTRSTTAERPSPLKARVARVVKKVLLAKIAIKR